MMAVVNSVSAAVAAPGHPKRGARFMGLWEIWRVVFVVGRDVGGVYFGLCGGAGAGTPYLGSDVMEFLAILGRGQPETIAG